MGDYLKQFVNKAELEALSLIGDAIEPLFGELGVEMKAIAKTLGMKVGEVVLLNVAYELRSIGGGDTNTTGGLPTPPPGPPSVEDPFVPGMCTTVIANDATSKQPVLARNMDWSIPNRLRNLTFRCDFTKGGEVIFTGACIASYVGMASGIRYSPSGNGYAVTINERSHGGNLFIDVLSSILKGGEEVTHSLRRIFEEVDNFDDAVVALEQSKLAAPVYYNIAGGQQNDGLVITRDRMGVAHSEQLADSVPFLAQTNYDWNKPAPPQDDRRAFIQYFMRELDGNYSAASLFGAVSTFPDRSCFTSYQFVAQPALNEANVYIRYYHEDDPEILAAGPSLTEQVLAKTATCKSQLP
jgi:hypothetical protein